MAGGVILIPQPAHRVRHQPPRIDRPLQRQIFRRRTEGRHVFIRAELHRYVVQDHIQAARVQIDAIPAAAAHPMPHAHMPQHDVITGKADRAALEQNPIPRSRLPRDGELVRRHTRRHTARERNRPRHRKHNRPPARRDRRHPFKKRPRAAGVEVGDHINISTASPRRISPKALRSGEGRDLSL